ncbi:MAG TPA: NUDIX domain-containing protein [Chitinophagaceae bacterium]
MRKSAGILMFRRIDKELEVLLVHPGGPFWKNKDQGAWSIPKGEFTNSEDPLDAAIREFEEETGVKLQGNFIELEQIQQKGGKLVLAWAIESDLDPSSIRSNTFSMEWPPKSGKWIEVPEIDKASWFAVEEAREKINPAQQALLEDLKQKLSL